MNLLEPTQIIFSKRKTLGLQIKSNGDLVVRSPLRLSKYKIEEFILQKQNWIIKTRQKVLNRVQNIEKSQFQGLSFLDYKDRVESEFTAECLYWQEVTGLFYTSLKFSKAKTKWGSCSSKNVISLNWKLLFAPKAVLSYVVIHELAHIKHKNHSSKFWNLVELYDPNWRQHRNWLKTEGHTLI